MPPTTLCSAPPLRQRATQAETDHRPWPLPERSWFMGQTWENLLFAHWRVAREVLEPVVPPQLPIDTAEGSAWIGVTPFIVRSLRLRGTPPMPVLSTFPEINVRTYFLSLDADSRSAAFSARAYRLPYFRSRISARIERGGEEVRFSASRRSADGPPAQFDGRYGRVGEAEPAEAGTLPHWLAERYRLYTLDAHGRVVRGEIHHPPWPLQSAWLDLERNTMTAPFGIALEGDPLLHYSARQDVILWRLASIR